MTTYPPLPPANSPLPTDPYARLLPGTHFGWHFTQNNGLLRDNTPVPPVGEWLYRDWRNLDLCRYGLHVGVTPTDALNYANGTVLSYVECAGVSSHRHPDKFVCACRRRLKSMDAAPLIDEYARYLGLAALDELSDADITQLGDVVLDWLMIGKYRERALERIRHVRIGLYNGMVALGLEKRSRGRDAELRAMQRRLDAVSVLLAAAGESRISAATGARMVGEHLWGGERKEVPRWFDKAVYDAFNVPEKK